MNQYQPNHDPRHFSESNPHAQYMPPPAQHAKTKKLPWWGWTLLVLGALIIVAGIFGQPSDPAKKAGSAGLPNVVTTPTPTPTVVAKPTPKPSAIAPRTKEVAPPAKPKLSVSQQQAIKSAENYIDFMPFSRKGLIHQLKYEGFTTVEATYAVDHIGADWMTEAEQSAASYMATGSFSRSSLLNQLKYEGFTTAQALHGVKSVGL